MSKRALKSQESSASFVRTRTGILLDTNLDLWSFRDSAMTVRIDFNRIKPLLTEDLFNNVKDVCKWYLQYLGSSTTNGTFQSFCMFFEWCHTNYGIVSEITGVMYINFINSLGKTKASYQQQLKNGFQRWNETGIHGLSEDVLPYLKQVKTQRTPSGLTVRTMDPVRGPFTHIELAAIQDELTKHYNSGLVTDKNYLLASLFIMLGMRPVQYAALKLCDVFTTTDSNDIVSYFIRMPRAKQGNNLRDLFSVRAITPNIGKILVEYKERLLTQETAYENHENGPLFQMDETQPFLLASDTFKGHCTSSGIVYRLINTLSKLQVYSERTGELIHISSRRFRQTIGTRAAEEGHGKLIIAELLDHTTTNSVGVYVQSTPAILKRIDKAIALQMAPLAQAFSGILVDNAEDAIRGNDSNSLVLAPDYTSSFKPIGNCGSFEFSKTGQALACYTCKNFQPWLDAEHEKVLDRLLISREQLQSTTDNRIASINDRLILAVAEVVRLCNKHLEELSND